MNATSPFLRFPPFTGRRLTGIATGLFAVLMLTSPAQAGFHLWTLREVYTDVSGSLQFIEMVDNSGGQNFVGGHTITVQNIGATQTHTFTVPSNVSSSAGNALLFGTAGVQAAGGPVPNFIIPNNFLFAAGGTISFFGANSGAYAALPTDGSLSRTWTGGNAVNSPQNLAGQTGTIVVPEPATWTLLGAGLTCLTFVMRRRTR